MTNKLPYELVIAFLSDYIAASKEDFKGVWTEDTPWNLWIKLFDCQEDFLDKESKYLLKKLLWNLKEMRSIRFIEWFEDVSETYLKPHYDAGDLESYEKDLPNYR